MAPPQLAADTPILDVVHPLVVGVHPLFRHESHCAALYRVNGFLGDRFASGVVFAHLVHGDKPLVGEHGLHHLASAGADGQHVFVRFDLDDVIARLQVGQKLLARGVAIQPMIGFRAVFVDVRIQREDGNERQIVP